MLDAHTSTGMRRLLGQRRPPERKQEQDAAGLARLGRISAVFALPGHSATCRVQVSKVAPYNEPRDHRERASRPAMPSDTMASRASTEMQGISSRRPRQGIGSGFLSEQGLRVALAELLGFAPVFLYAPRPEEKLAPDRVIG